MEVHPDMDYPDRLNGYRNQVEDALEGAVADCEGPTLLKDAMGYSLLAGGKRLRPVLLLVTRDIFLPGGADPMPAACALEFIHTYSLIHDDLPAMDDDDFRRNRPSCHRRFDEPTAILAGDALLTEAFRLLGDAYSGDGAVPNAGLVVEMASAAGSGGMVGGQALDTLETGRAIGMDRLELIHRMKTGALIRAAVRCGAILGGAEKDELDVLTGCSEAMGLAFQVVDDVLDVVGSRESLGKTTGKDNTQGKTTYVTLMGVEDSLEYARRLAEEVRGSLARFGDRARTFVELSDFIVNRAS